jgi:hypothetical protein
MAKIFIAYRRRDATFFVNAIEDELQQRFGKRSVIRDVNANIPLGTDFRKYLRDAVANSDILLAIIGKRWLETIRERADDATDFLRIEIEAALEGQIPVVPILVDGAQMPGPQDLPDSISEMIFRQAAEVHHKGRKLSDELEQLGAKLAAALQGVGVTVPPPPAGKDLILRISANPKTGGIGVKFRWTVTVRNDGDAPFRDVAVFRDTSRTPLKAPFDLAPGRSRRLPFTSRYRVPGRKTSNVHAVGTTASGQEVRVATKTSVQVQ